jgi:signal transduction histidine kinase
VRDVYITNAMVPGTTRHVASLIDITEWKQAEAEKDRLEGQLLQAQKMEAIGQLAGGVAHDFNNILTTVIGYGNLLQMKIDRDDPRRHYVDHILASSQRAAQLTHSLLAFSRKQVMEMRPQSVNGMVQSAEKLLARLLTEDIEVSLSLADVDSTVLADQTQFEHVLINLATNARDAMPGGGRLSITTAFFEMDDVFVRTKGYGLPGAYALITVADTGIGMDEKTASKIFEPFFTTKDVGKGTGLGLSIVYGVVKQHSGFIDVESLPGRGTSFRIYLPLVQSVAVTTRQEVPEAPPGTETVLLAEDSTEVRLLLRQILEGKGYRVHEARDGEEALRLFAGHKEETSLAILDVVMPKQNGRQVYEGLLRMKPDIKVLFISGYTADIIVNKGIPVSSFNYITKPVMPEEFLLKVREVLDG